MDCVFVCGFTVRIFCAADCGSGNNGRKPGRLLPTGGKIQLKLIELIESN